MPIEYIQALASHQRLHKSIIALAALSYGGVLNECHEYGFTLGPWFNKTMTAYQYRKSHCGDKTILRQSYLHNEISYTGNMSSLYWIGPLIPGENYNITLALLKKMCVITSTNCLNQCFKQCFLSICVKIVTKSKLPPNTLISNFKLRKRLLIYHSTHIHQSQWIKKSNTKERTYTRHEGCTYYNLIHGTRNMPQRPRYLLLWPYTRNLVPNRAPCHISRKLM